MAGLSMCLMRRHHALISGAQPGGAKSHPARRTSRSPVSAIAVKQLRMSAASDWRLEARTVDIFM